MYSADHYQVISTVNSRMKINITYLLHEGLEVIFYVKSNYTSPKKSHQLIFLVQKSSNVVKYNKYHC